MNEFQPRLTLPEEWAKQAACPVCRQKKLQVIHSENRPDCMDCSYCGVTFEIAQDGSHMRLINLPDIISHPLTLPNTWMTAAELRSQIDYDSFIQSAPPTEEPQEAPQNATAPVQPEPEQPAPAVKSKMSAPPVVNEVLAQEDVTWRVIELAKLGNPPTTIRLTLSRQGATPEQIEIGLKELANYKRKQPARKNFWLWIVIIVVIMCVIMSCIGLLVSGQIGQMLPAA